MLLLPSNVNTTVLKISAMQLVVRTGAAADMNIYILFIPVGATHRCMQKQISSLTFKPCDVSPMSDESKATSTKFSAVRHQCIGLLNCNRTKFSV